MIKAILFDMDGTLVDTGSIGFEVFEETLKNNNLKYTEEEVMSIANRSFTQVLKEFFEKNNKEYKQKIRDDMVVDYTERIKKANTLPYAKELLEAIHDKAITILATFSLTPQVSIVLANNDLDKYFDKIVCADTKDYEEKKDMLKDILTETSLKPEECILIEDSHYGVKSGQHNGIFTIGVKHYFDDIGADVMVDDLEAAKTIILEKMKEE